MSDPSFSPVGGFSPAPVPGPAQALLAYLGFAFLYQSALVVLTARGWPPAATLPLLHGGILFGGSLILARAQGVSLRETFSWRLPRSWADLILAVIAVAALGALLADLAWGQDLAFRTLGMNTRPALEDVNRQISRLTEYGPAAALGLVAVLPAVCEETLFRGYLLTGFRRDWGAGAGVAISAALFGLMHAFVPDKILMQTLQGVLFGYLVVRTGSIWPSVTAHFVNNAAIVSLMMLRPSEPAEIASDVMPVPLPALAVAGIALAACLWGIGLSGDPRPLPPKERGSFEDKSKL